MTVLMMMIEGNVCCSTQPFFFEYFTWKTLSSGVSKFDIDADYKAFVGSRRKMASIREKFIADGASAEAFDFIKAPAGIDIGAISPEEIALSIIAEVTARRRQKTRTR